MLKRLWLGLMLVALVYGAWQGKFINVLYSIPNTLLQSVSFILILTVFMILWLAILRIAEHAGLVKHLAAMLSRPMRWLFPDVPSEHKAQQAIVMNLSANMIGLNNAATPLGIKAMQYLDELNQYSNTASHAMCTLLALNTSSVQLVPATTLAFLIAAGADHASLVIYTSLFATSCSTLAAIICIKLLALLRKHFNSPQVM